MSTPSKSVRRLLWLAGALFAGAGLIVWLVASRPDGGTERPTTTSETVLAAVATPGAEPSSVPTGTPGAEPSSGPTGTPSPGSLEEVPVEEAVTEPAVPLTATADFGTEMRLRIMRIESVHGLARGTGEIAGPALRLTLRMSNGSDSPVSLEGAVIDLASGAAQNPAPTLSGPGAEPFQGEIPAGRSMTAVYVFAVPVDERDRLRVAVSYVSDAPVVVLAGAAR